MYKTDVPGCIVPERFWTYDRQPNRGTVVSRLGSGRHVEARLSCEPGMDQLLLGMRDLL